MKFNYDFNIETQRWEIYLTVGKRTESCSIEFNPRMSMDQNILAHVKNMVDTF